jgi:hypothetical protein
MTNTMPERTATAGQVPTCVVCLGEQLAPATRTTCLRCCGTGLDPDPVAPTGIPVAS